MKILSMLSMVVCLLTLSGCSGLMSFDRDATGVVRCDPKDGFNFPPLEYDAKDPETTLENDLVLGPQSLTFRNRLTGKMMTIGKELSTYYDCKKVG